MASNKLVAILQDLGRSTVIPIRDLAPDRNNSCLISLPGGIEIQLESDREEKNLMIGCKLSEVPLGRYRENLFKEALKANGQQDGHGSFGYIPRTNQLVLFDMLSYNDLSGEKVADYLEKFLEKAMAWRTAINNGEIPSVVFGHRSGSGMFGLR